MTSLTLFLNSRARSFLILPSIRQPRALESEAALNNLEIMYIPFFQAGTNHHGSETKPLGLINGLLLLDSGEVERTFIFRCQERYLTYNSLCGLQSVFFVAHREHREKYRVEIARRGEYLRAIKNASRIPFGELSQPLFVPCDIDR